MEDLVLTFVKVGNELSQDVVMSFGWTNFGTEQKDADCWWILFTGRGTALRFSAYLSFLLMSLKRISATAYTAEDATILIQNRRYPNDVTTIATNNKIKR